MVIVFNLVGVLKISSFFFSQKICGMELLSSFYCVFGS